MDEDTSWQRQLLVGAVALLAVAILVGGTIAVVALKAADVAGITEEGQTTGPATIQTTPDASQSSEPPTTGQATTEETTSEPATSAPITSAPATSGPAASDGTTTPTTPTAPTTPDFTTPEFTPPEFTTPEPTTTTPTPEPTTAEPPTTRPTRPPGDSPLTAIQLSASPQSAGTYDRVNLSGSYPSAEGTTLQVQRYEFGAWVDFPTSATVSGGTFSTYIQTGRSGLNRFRVLDTSTGRASNVVTVSIS